MSDLIDASYQRQEEHGRDVGLPAGYAAPDSVDNWRHLRMFTHLDPHVQVCPDACLLTVVDGAYGSDAHFLLSRGAKVVASSLVPDQLAVAAERGFIKDYLQINAERITLPDGAFDFVLCKAAYHHFPRPPIALYEMLRVAPRAVVRIEPIEQHRPLDALRGVFKCALRLDRPMLFEPSRNYIYRISLRELESPMLTLGERAMAHRAFNDLCLPSLARDNAQTSSPDLRTSRLGIGVQNVLARTRLMGWGLCAVVLFKGSSDESLRQTLQASAYVVSDLAFGPLPHPVSLSCLFNAHLG